MVQLTLTQAVEQFNRYLRATGKSPNTIADYNNSYNKLIAHLAHNPPLADITITDLEIFFDNLRTHPVTPTGIAPRPPRTLSPKTIQNIHAGLSSLWTWALKRKFVTDHIPRAVPVDRPSPPPITTFAQDEIQAMLHTCFHSASWGSKPGTHNTVPRPRALRDQAIILFLLDTGLRVTEACGLTLTDVEMEDRLVHVQAANAKNRKPRDVPFGRRVALALLDYLATRPEAIPNDPLFSTMTRRDHFTEEHFSRQHLGRHLTRIGQRAGISGRANPHRFRHTFATEFLRNGGDVHVLQKLLGHASLEMVWRYVHYVQADINTAHRRASPADNWKLKLQK